MLTTRSSQIGSGLRPASANGSVMFSMAVRVGTRLKAWKMKPIFSRRRRVRRLSLSVVRSTSPMRTDPLVRPSSPATVCMSVLLPEPDGPMMAVNSPA